MTAGKLKKILANIPDDTRLFIEEDMGIIRADVEPRLGIGRSGSSRSTRKSKTAREY
jgi:hypothetical protein